MHINQIIHGNSSEVLAELPEGSIDLVVTDPPYLVNYRDRDGRSLKNDDNPDGVLPVFAPMARAMKQNSFAICFSGWSALPEFTAAWKAAGCTPPTPPARPRSTVTAGRVARAIRAIAPLTTDSQKPRSLSGPPGP